MGILRKLVANNVVVVLTGLPNLAINFGVQAILDIGFHWSGAFSLLAYLIGVGCSVQYSVVFSMLTKSHFKILGREWHFSHKDERTKP